MDSDDSNGWPEWSRHVLKELKRLDENIDDANNKLSRIQIDIATLQVKSGIWGMMGGLIPVILYVAFKII